MEIRENANAVSECLKKLKADGNNVILYGAGYCGHEALALMQQYGISVRAVCDDFRAGEVLDGYEILHLEDISPDVRTVIFVTSGFNAKMKQRIKQLGLFSYYREMDFGRYDAEKENVAYFKRHEVEVKQAWKLLADDKSRIMFQNLVNYRISRDLKYLEGMEEENQYFPSRDDILVHGGGTCLSSSIWGHTMVIPCELLLSIQRENTRKLLLSRRAARTTRCCWKIRSRFLVSSA